MRSDACAVSVSRGLLMLLPLLLRSVLFCAFGCCAVSGCDNCIYDFLIGCRAFHSHGVGQQADRAGSHTRHFGDGFSTRAEHAAQLMPVTSYCFIVASYISYFINFCNIVTNSSTLSSSPFRMPSATQVRICCASRTLLKLLSAALAAATCVMISGQ